jgi:hypothetical protein
MLVRGDRSAGGAGTGSDRCIGSFIAGKAAERMSASSMADVGEQHGGVGRQVVIGPPC